MLIFTSLLTLIIGLLLGFWGREVWEYLKGIKTAVMALKIRQEKQEQQAKKMSFADPVDFNTLDDKEKIDFLNM